LLHASSVAEKPEDAPNASIVEQPEEPARPIEEDSREGSTSGNEGGSDAEKMAESRDGGSSVQNDTPAGKGGVQTESGAPTGKLDSDNNASQAADTALGKGDNILARHGGGCNWYPGAISGANPDGTYDIRYADGDTEQGILRYRIKREGDEERPELQEGDVVDARHNGGKRAYPGRIKKAYPGKYDILYNDGDSEMGLQRDFIYGLCEELPAGSVAVRSGSGSTTMGSNNDPPTETETTAIESLEEVELDLT
jgi:hypothetical protein